MARSNVVYLNRLRRYGDAREKAMEMAMYRDYMSALETAIGKYKAFIEKVEDVRTGVYRPPEFYVKEGPEAVERWKRGFITELLRRGQVVEGIAEELNRAGTELPLHIRAAMADVYTFNHNAVLEKFNAEARVDLGISGISRDAARVLYQSRETPLTQLAYQRYADADDIEDRLRREFLTSLSTGESTKKLTQRVAAVTQGETVEEYIRNGKDPFLRACKSVVRYEMDCARRIAQTELTRIQSQASYDACEKARAIGVEIVNEWSCQMIPKGNGRSGSRDTHIKLHGQRRRQGEPFDLSDGDKLFYPGDPKGRACNVINCHCTLIPHVLMPGERV